MNCKKIFVFLVLILFLPWPLPINANSSDIIITEIGAYENSDHEWIEIYNKSTSPIDLTGWKFFEDDTNHTLTAFRGDLTIDSGEYAIIADVAANTASQYPTFTGTLVDSSWNTLNEGGEKIALKDKDGNTIEELTYVSCPNHSLERVDLNLNDYTANNWKEHSSGNTLGTINSVNTNSSTPPTNPPTEPNPPVTPNPDPPATTDPIPINYTPAPPAWQPQLGDVLINEFVADPSDDDIEWVELYNPGSHAIDLANWTIEDGAKTKTVITGTLGTSSNNRFFVIEKPKGNLNNAGDAIILKDANQKVIDQVSYGSYDDGNIENNAPKASDPSSVARITDGYNAFNNANDFKITEKPTKGISNIIIRSEVTTTTSSVKTEIIKTILVSEILPNPLGDDSKEEFIELHNTGATDIELKGWQLINSAGKKYSISNKDFKDTICKAGQYFLLSRTKTGMALKNIGGENIKLYQPGIDQANDIFYYNEKAPQGQSLIRVDSNLSWTSTPTPGAENILAKINQPPEPELEAPKKAQVDEEIVLDASDSTDPDNDFLTYYWDFGDSSVGQGAILTHHYSRAGEYLISLTVKDLNNQKNITKKIEITASKNSDNLKTTTTDSGGTDDQSTDLEADESKEVATDTETKELSQPAIEQIKPSSAKIYFSEILPNPEGKDVNEFIEIYNPGDMTIDLNDWQLKSNKKSYKIKNLKVKPKQYYTFTQALTKISLNNTSEKIQLIDSSGKTIDSISYTKTTTGASYTKDQNGNWQWTKNISQGKANPQIVSPILKAATTKSSSIKTDKPVVKTSITEAKKLPLNTKVVVEGIVSVKPGQLGKTIFYISGSGIQIYNANKNFPNLKIGDQVQVSGTLTKSNEEFRIKTNAVNDIMVIKHLDPPQAKEVELDEINDELEGYLIKFTGEITEAKWPNLYLDDGENSIRIYINKATKISNPKIKGGDQITITGILSHTKTGYRILPRDNQDIILANKTEAKTPTANDLVSQNINGNKNNKTTSQYLIITCVALGLLSCGLFIQYRKKVLAQKVDSQG